MAKGKTTTATIIVNNKPSTTITKTLEQVVVDNRLVPDRNDTEPGVNSATNKN